MSSDVAGDATDRDAAAVEGAEWRVVRVADRGEGLVTLEVERRLARVGVKDHRRRG